MPDILKENLNRIFEFKDDSEFDAVGAASADVKQLDTAAANALIQGFIKLLGKYSPRADETSVNKDSGIASVHIHCELDDTRQSIGKIIATITDHLLNQLSGKPAPQKYRRSVYGKSHYIVECSSGSLGFNVDIAPVGGPDFVIRVWNIHSL